MQLRTESLFASQLEDAEIHIAISFQPSSHQLFRCQPIQCTDRIRLPGACLPIRKKCTDSTATAPRDERSDKIVVDLVGSAVDAVHLVELEA